MTGRERVQSAIDHREGEVPIDFGANPVTGIHVQLVERIRQHYGLAERPVKVIDPFQMLGEIDDDLKAAIGIDTDSLWGPYTLFGFRLEGWKEWRAPWGQLVMVPEGFRTTVGSDGTTFLYPAGDTKVPPSGRLPASGHYFDTIVRRQPVDDEKLNPADNIEEFPLLTDQEIHYFADAATRLRGSSRFVFGSLTGDTGLGDIARVPGPMLKHPKGIRDEAEWYISTLTRQPYLHKVFDIQSDRAVINLRRIHEVVGDLLGGVFICGTDFGTQSSLFCSPEHFDTLWAPYYKKVNDWIHEHTRWKTFKHSCGAIEPLCQHFVDAGFDIINPVQISAAGMDPGILKRKYGDSLVFWGGGIDTQKTLPFGNPSQVREEVLRNLEVFSKGGGYVFNAIHNVQGDTPTGNFVAMVNAVHEFNGRW